MALAVQTPVHLQSIGLLSNVSDSEDAELNYLLKSALEKVFSLEKQFTFLFRLGYFDY